MIFIVSHVLKLRIQINTNTNTTTNDSKKRKNREESYMNESNIQKGSRKRQCRRY
jgi:hypothetical protein